MTILFPLEIKNREFHSKIFLASKVINNTNFDLVIGEKNKVYNLFKNNDGMYLLSKGGPRPGFRFDKKLYKNNYLGILDEEGPILNLDVNEKKTRLHKHILNNIDDYFLWGRKDFNFNKYLLRNYNKKLLTFGHPKFDILKKNQLKFYEIEIKKLKKIYKKFIFVSSSFPVDQIMEKNLFNKFRFYNFEMGARKNEFKSDFNRYLDNEKINYIHLIELLKKFAINNPKIQIIFRPHPRQDIELVKKRFGKKISNIKIIYEGVITPWIAACELYIHSGCSSFLEAATLQKKIIYFVKKDHPKKAKMFREFGYYFRDELKCLNFLNSKIKNKKFNIKSSKLPTQIIENSNKDLSFYKLYIQFMKNKYTKKLKPLKILYNNEKYFYSNFLSLLKISIKYILLKIPFFVELMFILNPSSILTTKYKKKKFPYLDEKEVNSFLTRSLKKNKIIKIKKLSDDLFLIKNFK